MKRDDMLKIIYLASCKEVPYHDDGGIQLQWRVENILNAIEEAGMLPPAVTKYIHQGNKDYTEYHRWEPDDE